MTNFGICLIAAGSEQAGAIGRLLRECGLCVWTPNSPAADDGHIYERAVCLVIDMPGDAGVRTLQLLRDYNVRTPALLVVDAGYRPGPAELKNAWVLEVIPRTADPRVVLHWIESMCLTQRLLGLVRSSRSEAAGAQLHGA